MSSDLKGTFVWHELMTSDATAAEAFYRKVIGWRAQEASQPGMPYTLLLADQIPVAGLMAMPAEACAVGAKPGWIGYIAVENVDVAAARVQEAGGSLKRAAEDIPEIGRFAVVADPQGAVFVLFTGSGPAPEPAPRTPGHVGWNELNASDWEAAFAFYADVFGWHKTEAVDMGSMGTYQLFAAGKDAIGGMMSKTTDVPPAWLYYFTVDGIDSAAVRVGENGGRVLDGPHEVPGGSWIIQCEDPQGAMFALVAPRR